MIRSTLFVPADSERKLAKAGGAGADALVLDLEDAVLPQRKPAARQQMREYLAAHAAMRDAIWVRVNDRHSGELLKDLAVVVPARPAGILLPKIRGPEDLSVVGHYLDALESEHGLVNGQIRITAIVCETPAVVLRLGEIVAQAHPRIHAVTWGVEDLSAALGGGDPRFPGGGWRPPYAYARSQCVLAAHALGAEALDTVYVDFRNLDGLRQSCIESRSDGFTGRMAIHPDQVAIINEAFSPTEAERQRAQRIIEAFAGQAGAVAIDGKMHDVPHLNWAQRILAR